MNDSQKPTLLLIDGHSLAFRAFYALSPDGFKMPSGQHTNAVHGFISMLLNILGNEKPTHLAVAFDISRFSFRTEIYPEYKGTRGETPPEFNGQTELLEEALAAMNIRTLTRENFEADDLLASLADQGAAAGYRVLLVSGDRDTFQLISENTTILYPVKGVMNLVRMTDEAVVEKYGIHAVQYPDLAALVGETSDNLPGIPGVGPKTAAKWIQQYGGLDQILAAADEIPGKVGESLREHRELAVRNRHLNHLVRDLDLGLQFDELQLRGVDGDKVKEVFAKLHFRTLTERVLRLRGVAADTGSNPDAGASGGGGAAADPTGDSTIDSSPFEEIEIPEDVAVDAKALVAFAKDHERVGVALRFGANGALEQVGVAGPLKRLTFNIVGAAPAELLDWLAEADGAHKATYDSKNAERALIGVGAHIAGVTEDALLYAYLLNPVRRGYALDDLALEYLGIEVKRGDPNQLLSDDSADCSLDAWLALQLGKKLAALVEAQQQTQVYREVELPSSPVLAQMEATGVSLNREKLEAMLDQLAVEIKTAEQEAFAIIGHEINLASPKQLQTVLFEELGMKGTKSVKTGFSTNAAALNELFEQTEHPFLEKLLAHREVTKMRQMVEVLVKSIGPDGRIHTSYVQTGTSTGRLSSENPNLQNIPIKSERGRLIRDAFRVGEGYETLLTADYSQIEMRIMAHLSEDEGLIEAFNTGEDLHRFVGARIFGVAPAEVTPAMRSKVKAMSYGLVYGLSEYGLAKQLRISKGEAKQLMVDYFDRFGGVQRYLASVVDEAKRRGYTVTAFGRRRPFDDLSSPIFQLRENARRAALNAPMQGTAADIMKLAMINVADAMKAANLKSRMLLQVHDELVFEVSAGEVEQLQAIVEDKMSNVVKLSVPLEVQIGIGQTWDAAAH